MYNLIAEASIALFFFGLFGVDWDFVDKEIQSEFPEVEMISTDDLYNLYKRTESVLPVIIDVRDAKEFKVSHLKEAINLSTAEEIAELFMDKDVEIVVYCSVGYRSAAVAAELEKLAYTNVRNLHHSIFEWANKVYPLLNENGDTNRVHPYNRSWGVLLNDTLHQYP
ncbi:MAG: rhodanese-related sulfurtransferase [Planctomycetota bacterium]